jgi:hypothetical protein
MKTVGGKLKLKSKKSRTKKSSRPLTLSEKEREKLREIFQKFDEKTGSFSYIDVNYPSVGHTKIRKYKPAKEASEGLKFDAGKPPFDLLPGESLEEIAKVLAFGAKKYAAHNWRKGISISRLMGAAFRHGFKFNEGQDTDEETGLMELAHMGCCILFAIWMMKNKPELDDRWNALARIAPEKESV